MTDDKRIRLPARDVPIPGSISPQAQNSLWEQSSNPVSQYPDLADTAAWLEMQTNANAAMVLDFRTRPRLGRDIEGHVRSQPIEMDGVAGFLASPVSEPRAGRIVFDIHGGG